MEIDQNALSLEVAQSLYDSALARVSSLDRTVGEEERQALEQIDATLETLATATVQPANLSLLARARSLRGMAQLSLAFKVHDRERRSELIRSGASLLDRSAADLASGMPATAVSLIPDQLEALAAAMRDASGEDKQYLTEVYGESFGRYVASLQQVVMLRDEGAAKVLQAEVMATAAGELEPGRDRTVLLWEAAELSSQAARFFAVVRDEETLGKAVEVHRRIREKLGVAGAGAQPKESWFYLIGGVQREGPVSREQLEALLARGELTTDTFVWKAGMAEWRKVLEVGITAAAVSGAAPEAPPAALTPTPPAAMPARGRIFCTRCGTQLDVGDAFCPQCGQKT
ncbi:MAG: DUF4339 domain-containing protein [Thermoleophilia bacterium]|nr:DUF4339 domain-containing protein [Thermoleophilia bacterium]